MHKPPVRRRSRAFTLVELLIVAAILGILAAIVIPQFQTFSGDASAAALKTDLLRLRTAIRRYEADHGALPSAARFEAQMTLFSDRAGGTSTSRSDTHQFGPYLSALPKLPVGHETGSTAVTDTAGTAGCAWVYVDATGEIFSNTADTETDGDGVKFNSY